MNRFRVWLQRGNTSTPPGAYPLQARFRWVVLPLLLVSSGLGVAGLGWSGGRLVTQVYLGAASRQAEWMRAEMERIDPAWVRHWSQSPPPLEDGHAGALRPALAAWLDQTTADRGLSKVKVYDAHGVIRYSSAAGERGRIERGPVLAQALASGTNQAAVVQRPGGQVAHELYVFAHPPSRDRGSPLLFEFYEPVNWLADWVQRAALQAVLPALLGLAAVLSLLWRWVAQAQREINARATQVAGLQTWLERLVSRRAVATARNGPMGMEAEGHLLDVALYHADVRDFTGFSASQRPQAVVAFLNELVALQVAAIHQHGGDVDKLVGDALLAVFTGPERAERAVAAAQQVLTAVARRPDLPRQLGIGVHEGFVVAGLMGTPDRMDDTVIGDAVNRSARLCDLARAGELVVDRRTLARAGHPLGFSKPESQSVKGVAEAVEVCRWQPIGD